MFSDKLGFYPYCDHADLHLNCTVVIPIFEHPLFILYEVQVLRYTEQLSIIIDFYYCELRMLSEAIAKK